MLYVLLCVLVLQSFFDGKVRAGCFVCLPGVSRDCCVALPCGAMGLSAVCDYGTFILTYYSRLCGCLKETHEFPQKGHKAYMS